MIFDTTIEALLRQADAIIEADADTTYLGFCTPGTTGMQNSKSKHHHHNQMGKRPKSLQPYFW